MRSANLIVVILGIAGTTTAAVVAWRWRCLPLFTDVRPAVETRHRAAIDGLRTLAVVMAAGVLAGALVPGLGGRLAMRILGATSGDAQGVRTAANQPVGEITNSGSIEVIVFVGLFGGAIAALAFLVVRRWLPTTAGPAGALAGVLLLGTIGVSDALSPDNKDFAILRPTWLAVTLVVSLALLFGVTFTALAARLDAGMPTLAARPSSIASHAALIVYLVPFLLAGAAVYVTGRAAARGRFRSLLTNTPANASDRQSSASQPSWPLPAASEPSPKSSRYEDRHSKPPASMLGAPRFMRSSISRGSHPSEVANRVS